MGYVRSKPDVKWDRPGLFQGVTIVHEIGGQRHAWKVPWNGVVNQAMAADILDVSIMAVNNWVRAGTVRSIKPQGQPSLIPFSEIKRVRKILVDHGRLRRDAVGP